MRRCYLLPFLLVLAACSFGGDQQPVDISKLPPLTGQERALLIAADAAAIGGDTASAERNYLSAIAQSKGHIVAHQSLARLYMSQNQPEKAEDILKKAAALQPNDVETNHLLGKIALNDNRPAEALERFNAGLKADPTNPDMLSGAGIANDLMHRHDAAQVIYLRALSLRPNEDMSMVRTNLAMSYLLDDQPKKAVELLKAEVKKPNAPAAMRHNLALAYGVLGKHVEARTLLKKEISEEERLQSLKRLEQHIAMDKKKTHPADKVERKPAKKPAQLPPRWLQPRVHRHL